MGSQGLNEKLCEGQALQAERTPGSQVLKRGSSFILDIQGMQQELVLENNVIGFVTDHTLDIVFLQVQSETNIIINQSLTL